MYINFGQHRFLIAHDLAAKGPARDFDQMARLRSAGFWLMTSRWEVGAAFCACLFLDIQVNYKHPPLFAEIDLAAVAGGIKERLNAFRKKKHRPISGIFDARIQYKVP